MEDSELHDILERLHRELEHTDNLDDESRLRLQQLMGDIRAALDREASSSDDEDQSLIEQLNEAIQRYEFSNPGLTATIRHALDILSGSGI